MLYHIYSNGQYKHVGKNLEDPQGVCLLKIIVNKTGSHHFLSGFYSLGDKRVGNKGRKSGKRSDSGG